MLDYHIAVSFKELKYYRRTPTLLSGCFFYLSRSLRGPFWSRFSSSHWNLLPSIQCKSPRTNIGCVEALDREFKGTSEGDAVLAGEATCLRNTLAVHSVPMIIVCPADRFPSLFSPGFLSVDSSPRSLMAQRGLEIVSRDV